MLKRIRFHLFKWFSPVMVGRYKRLDGVVLPETRISNSTYIDSPDKLQIDNNVFIGHFNFIDASNGLKICEGVQITNYVSVLTHSSHVAIRVYGKKYTQTPNKKAYAEGSVYIGAYTFVGPHSVIMPGTKIGKGCLVSAFSYVKGEFADFSIIAGNPALIVGDTRELDKQYLDANPELKEFYNEWANQ